MSAALDLDTAYTPTMVLARIVAAARDAGLLTPAEYRRACACACVVEQHARQRDEAMAQRNEWERKYHEAARDVERMQARIDDLAAQRNALLVGHTSEREAHAAVRRERDAFKAQRATFAGRLSDLKATARRALSSRKAGEWTTAEHALADLLGDL